MNIQERINTLEKMLGLQCSDVIPSNASGRSNLFRYCIYNDKENRQWIVEDKNDSNATNYVDYGRFTCAVLNSSRGLTDKFDGVNDANISDLEMFLKNADEMQQMDRFHIWEDYRHIIVAPAAWSIANSLGACGSAVYGYALGIINDAIRPYAVHDIAGLSLSTGIITDCVYTDNLSMMFEFDLLQSFVYASAGKLSTCKKCGGSFYTSDSKMHYCPSCKEKSNNPYHDTLKKTVRHLHKRIYDSLRQSKKYDDDFVAAFVAESNYYWCSICGKTPKTDKLSYYNDIHTEKKYQKWLENFLAHLKHK